MAPARKFLTDPDRLTGDGRSSCSHQEPASGNGDRWCVFTRPGATAASAELWIINLSKVVAGSLPACDGSSPDCRRLTANLWTGTALGGPAHPFSHQFEGDTLVFYADAGSPTGQVYRGPVYAWRPGWAEPGRVTSDAGLICFGHLRMPVVHCIDDIAGDPMRPDSIEIRAGSIAERPTAPLPSLGRIRPYRTNGAVAWQAGFSPDGTLFALSSPDPDPAVESLKVVATTELGRQLPREVGKQITGWAIGRDGKRVYYMRGDDPEKLSLHSDSFPDASAEVKLGDNVGQFLLLGEGAQDVGVSFISSQAGDRTVFSFTPDSRSAANTIAVFSTRTFLEDVHMSGDARFTGWLDGGFTGRVVRHKDLNVCRLNTTPGLGAYEPLFLHSAGLVFWNEDRPEGDLRDAFHARPDDCQGKRKFASGIGYYYPLGDRGLIFTDEKSPQDTMTLKYAAATNGPDGWNLETPVRVRENVEWGYFTLIGTEQPLAVFRTAAPEGGTHVFGPLPF